MSIQEKELSDGTLLEFDGYALAVTGKTIFGNLVATVYVDIQATPELINFINEATELIDTKENYNEST